jgi:hypothetical protein
MASGLGFFSGAESSAVTSAFASCGSIEAAVGFNVVVVVVVDRTSGAGFMLVRLMVVVWNSGSGPLLKEVEPFAAVRLMLVVWIAGCGPLQEQQQEVAVFFDSQEHRRA